MRTDETQLATRKCRELLLCLTPGNGLVDWQRNGTLERELAVYLEYVRRGWGVSVLSFKTDADQEIVNGLAGFSLFPFGPHRLLFLAPVLLFRRLREFALIKTNQSWRCWWYIAAARCARRPVMLRCGWLPMRKQSSTGVRNVRWKWYRWLEQWAFRSADWIQVSSDSDRQWLLTHYQVADTAIEVVPNFVDTRIFSPRNVEKFARSLCFVGRFNSQKNLDILLHAAALAKSERVLFIGEGELEGDLLNLASNLGLNLEIAGNIPQREIPDRIAPYQVFALVSSFEGHPKALIEAMACGMACVGSDIEGNSAIIRAGINGELCSRDKVDIARTLSRLYENENIRQALGKEARRTIESRFSRDEMIELELASVDRRL